MDDYDNETIALNGVLAHVRREPSQWRVGVEGEPTSTKHSWGWITIEEANRIKQRALEFGCADGGDRNTSNRDEYCVYAEPVE